MKRSFVEAVFSIQLRWSFPFLFLMQISHASLSDRLKLTTFIGRSGRPRRYAVSKVHGRIDGLRRSDTLVAIWFPAPKLSFRKVLSPQPNCERQKMGRYTWLWSKDGQTLYAFDDMEFHFSREEAKALDAVLFGEIAGIEDGDAR